MRCRQRHCRRSCPKAGTCKRARTGGCAPARTPGGARAARRTVPSLAPRSSDMGLGRAVRASATHRLSAAAHARNGVSRHGVSLLSPLRMRRQTHYAAHPKAPGLPASRHPLRPSHEPHLQHRPRHNF
eukprot:354449-Chlamydomonas_euryale.AAC.6